MLQLEIDRLSKDLEFLRRTLGEVNASRERLQQALDVATVECQHLQQAMAKLKTFVRELEERIKAIEGGHVIPQPATKPRALGASPGASPGASESAIAAVARTAAVAPAAADAHTAAVAPAAAEMASQRPTKSASEASGASTGASPGASGSAIAAVAPTGAVAPAAADARTDARTDADARTAAAASVPPMLGEAPRLHLGITIPEGVASGMPLDLLAPDGRRVRILVPEGMHPGMKLQVAMPPMAPPVNAQPRQEPSLSELSWQAWAGASTGASGASPGALPGASGAAPAKRARVDGSSRLDPPRLGPEDCGGCGMPVKGDARHTCVCGRLVHSDTFACFGDGASNSTLIANEGEWYCSVTCQLLGRP